MTAVAWRGLDVPFTPHRFTPPPTRPNIIKLLTAFYRNPLGAWPEALYHEPMIMDRLGGGRAFLVVSDPALARTVLLDDAASYERSNITNSVLRAGVGDGLLTTSGAVWRRQRRVAAPSFRPAEIAAYAPAMAEAGAAAGARLRAAAGADPVDVAQEMIRATFDVIVDTVLDGEAEPEERAQVAHDVGIFIEEFGRLDPFDIFAPGWTALPRPWRWRGERARARFKATCERIVAQKRARLSNAAPDGRLGLTDRLLRAADPEHGDGDGDGDGRGLSDAEVVDNVMTFVGAGHETTALTLTWTLYLLAQAPALQEAVAAEVAESAAGPGPLDPETAPLTQAVIKEALRLFPPAAGIARQAARPTQLGEIALKTADHVVVAIYPMHRHRALWRDPDAFDPSRFAPGSEPPDRFAFLPFGAGPHICIGMSFALLEAAVLLAEILRRVRVAPGPTTAVEPVLRITLRPKGGMPLVVTPR